MNTRKLFAAFLIFVSFFTCGMAQQPLQFSVIPTPPFSPRAGDYLDNPAQFFQVIMTNTSSQTLEVYLVLKIEMLFPEVARVEVPLDRRPAVPLTVRPQQTLLLNKMHYDQLFGHLRMEDLIVQNLKTDSYYDGRMNLLPEGTYQICFTALDFHSPFGKPEILSSDLGACATFDICYATSAPEIISPSLCMIAMPHDTLEPAQYLAVSWMPPAFSCGGVIASFLYALKIVEVMPGQDVQSAMDFNPSVLELNGLAATSFMIDTMLFQNMFMRGERYAVQVTASDMNPAGHILIANDGAGPVCSFVWGSVAEPGVIVTAPPVDEEEEEEEMVPHAPFIAGTGCMTDPPQNTTPYQGPLSGKTVQVGNFLMDVDQATQGASGWTGTGKVRWEPLGIPLNIQVSFNNIKVNENLQVFDGKVLSLAQGALTTHVPPSIQHAMDYAEAMNEYTALFNVDQPGSYSQKMEAFKEYVATQVQTIQHLSGEISLPVKVPTDIPGTDISIGIIGMVFTPTQAAMNAMATFRLPEAKSGTGAEWLAFIGQGLCFEPGALVSIDEGRLFLATDVAIQTIGGTEMQFKRAGTLGNQSDGTFIEWNDNGFHQGQIAFDVLLHNQIIEEFPDGRPNVNSRVLASFTAWFSDWNDWVATATVPPFQVRGLPGFSFSPNNITYDHSIVLNPDNIVFPENPSTGQTYGAQGNQWQGFYMDQLSVKLPPDFKPLGGSSSDRAELQLNQLIIDDFGVSFHMLALDPLPTGVLGGCAFSIDTVRVDVFKSDFHGASIAGGITLPIAADPLRYQGVLTTGGDELDYAFSIRPASDLSMPMWVATLTIDESSGLEIRKDPHGAAVSFLLHGDISLISSQSSQNVPYKFFMPGVGFQNLGLANRNPTTNNPEFYLSAGDWSQTSDQKSLGPFDVSIEVPLPYFENGEFGLAIESGFSILSSFHCSTTLNVAGQLNWDPLGFEPATAALKAVYLESIAIEGNFGPVDISGTLDFYYNHTTYGDGIRGEVSATFDPLVELQAVAQFGVKQQGNNPYTYWYVDASALFSAHIPLAPPLAMGGFSGGVYYNMNRQLSASHTLRGTPGTTTPDLNNPSQSASGVNYVPAEGSHGFKAGITLVLQETPSAFNATMEMECSFTDDRFDMLRITGDGYIMSNFPTNDSYLAKTTIEIVYDNSKRFLSFTADALAHFLLGARLNIPIRFEAYTDTGLWFLMMGDPHGDRITATLIDIDWGLLQAFLEAHCYMAFGNNLPNTDLPPPPDEIVDFLNLSSLSQHRASITTKPTNGMLFGAGIHGKLEVDLIVYCHLEAIAGFDVSLLHYQDAVCNDEPVGLYGWYGLGQVYGYFHGDVGLKIDVWFFKGKVSLCELTAGAFLKGGMPSPFWAEGRARVSGSVLNGLIRFSGSVTLDVGEPCYPPVGDPLAGIKVLEEIQPGFESFAQAQQEDPVSTFAIPRVTANLELSDQTHATSLKIEIPPSDENEYGEVRHYKFEISAVRLFQGINGNLAENQSGGIIMEHELAGYPHRNMVVIRNPYGFLEQTNYAIRVESIALQRFEDNTWELPIIDGKPQMRKETLDGYFRTGTRPNNIRENVVASYPLHRQRYFPRDEDFWVVCDFGFRDIWQADTTRVEAYVTRISDQPSPSDDHQLISFSWHNDTRSLRYTNPPSLQLQPNALYRFSIIRINREKEIEYLAAMSKENRRLIIKDLITNEVTHSMIEGSQLSSGQVAMMSVVSQPSQTYGEHQQRMDPSMDRQDAILTDPAIQLTEGRTGRSTTLYEEGRQTSFSNFETGRTQPSVDQQLVNNYFQSGSRQDYLQGDTQGGVDGIFLDPDSPTQPGKSPRDIMRRLIDLGSIGTKQDIISAFLDPSTQQDILLAGSGSLRGTILDGGFEAGLLRETDWERLQEQLFDKQPSPEPSRSLNLAKVLDLMTLDEYIELYQADTIDLRAQALVKESELSAHFEIDYIDTLFRIVFATSQYGSLLEKLQQYGSLVITHPNQDAESMHAAEPFEEYDLIGVPSAHITGDSPYTGPIPPFMKFYADYYPQHPRDLHWFERFNRRTHELLSWCGPPDPTQPWRPRSDVSIIAHPKQIEVYYQNTANKRVMGVFPSLAGPTGHEQYPGRHAWLVHHTGRNASGLPLLDANRLSAYEINNLKSPQPKTPQKLKYSHGWVQELVVTDLLVMQNFRNAYLELAVDFANTSGSGRRSRTNNWIDWDIWISEWVSDRTQIRMPAYQLSYFYTLMAANNPIPWSWGAQEIYTGHHTWHGQHTNIGIQLLDMRSIIPGPDLMNLNDMGWSYTSPENLKIHVSDQSPVLY